MPDDLRVCLERCLSEDASPAVLEQHLPRVREIIIHLLQGLKLKQAEYKRILVASQRGSLSSSSKRQSALADRPPQRSSRLIRQERQGVSENPPSSQPAPEPLEPNAEARTSTPRRSASYGAQAAPKTAPETLPAVEESGLHPNGVTLRDDGVQPVASEPVTPPPTNVTPVVEKAEDSVETSPKASAKPRLSTDLQGPANMSPRTSSLGRLSTSASTSKIGRSRSNVDVSQPADMTDSDPSMRALKSRDALERRASKRFSAYTFNKMGVGQGFGQSFGSGNLGMSMLSMGAVGGSPTADRSQSHRRTGSRRQKPSISEMPIEEQPPLPSSSTLLPKKSPRIGQASDVEELVDTPTPSKKTSLRGQQAGGVSTPGATATGGLFPPGAQGTRSPTPSQIAASSTESLPFADARQMPASPVKSETTDSSLAAAVTTNKARAPAAAASENSTMQVPVEMSRDNAALSSGSATDNVSLEADRNNDEISVFLQLGRQTRKATLDRTSEVGVARLRMLFVDRFAYSPGKDDFPTIYIKDVNSGVSYELEDLNDVTDGCLLTLNIEPLDQVKQHLDMSLGVITRELREVKAALAENHRDFAAAASRRPSMVSPSHELSAPLSAMPTSSKFSDREFAAAGQRVASRGTGIDAGASVDGSASMSSSSDAASGARMARELKAHYDEVLALRKEMAIMRQLQGDFSSDVGGLLAKMKEQTVKVRAIAATEVSAERNFIIAGKSRLDTSSQEVLTLVEDLQDFVDDLKLDVIQRGVKPKPATLKKIAGDIAKATRGLEEVEQYVQTVKPSWKKTWESELQNIVDEQEFLNHQEGLIADLRDDHTALQEVYENIQQVVKLRSAGRPTGGKYIPPLPEDGHDGLSTVMLEVRGQSIDHEKRLRALQAAERTRQKEISSRTDEFTDELAGFVTGKAGEGLRKTGGHLEAERIRSKRDKATLLAMFGAGGSGGAPTAASVDSAAIAKPKKLILGGGGGGAGSNKAASTIGSASIHSSTDEGLSTSAKMARNLSSATAGSAASFSSASMGDGSNATPSLSDAGRGSTDST